MDLNKKEKSELDYLRGYKKGIEDALKLINGEELSPIKMAKLEIR